MAIVMNVRGHAVPLTVGLLGARETRNVDTSLPLEAALIDDGALVVVDSMVSPPAPIVPPGDWKQTIETFDALPTTGNRDGDVRLVRDDHTAYVWHGDGEEWSLLSAPGGGGDGQTADTSDHFRLIMFSNGTVKAIPFSTPDPTAPTGVAVSAKLSSITVTWTAATVGASKYAILRNGVEVAQVAAPSTTYHDTAITVGSTYSYRLQTVDAYGQRSAPTTPVAGFVDPATNHSPTVAIRTWPAVLPTNGKAIVRVASADVDAQSLAAALSVDVGTVTPTSDPSVWTYTPA